MMMAVGKFKTMVLLCTVALMAVGCSGRSVFAQTTDGGKFVKGPFLQTVTTGSVWVCWETDKRASARIVVNQGGRKIATLKAPKAQNRHEVQIKELKPETWYDYTVELDGGEALGGRFRTAPQPGSSVEFALWGDSRSNAQVCHKISELIRKTGVPLTLHGGDLVRNGVSDPQTWAKEFFAPARDLLRNVVFYAVMGNHEYGRRDRTAEAQANFTNQFHQPGNERYYSFDYGDVHFLILDSDVDDDPKYGYIGDDYRRWSTDTAQYRFARQDLLSSKAKWKIVMFHRPIYVSGYKIPLRSMRLIYAPLFARANVDLLVAADEHNFQLTKPIRHYSEPDQKRPYWHMINAGGGANTYPVRDDEPISNLQGSFHHYVHVKIEGDQLRGRVIKDDGSEFATFVIDKGVQPKDQVYYEQVDFLHQLRQGLMIRDAETGAPGLMLEKKGQTRSFTIDFENPMPVPAHLTVRFEKHPQLAIAPAEQTIKLAPAGKVGFRRTLTFDATPNTAELTRSVPTPIVTVNSPLGINTISPTWTGSPGSRSFNLNIALPREYHVKPASGRIVLDGKLDDAGWKEAKVIDNFWAAGQGVIVKPGGPRHPVLSTITKLRVARGQDALYLAIEAPGKRKMARCDLYLKTPNGKLITAQIDSKSPDSSTAGAVKWVQKMDGEAKVHLIEIKIPYKGIGVTAPKAGDVWQFNVSRPERKCEYVWSPTTGPASIETAGRLRF